jgi:hypothetical protein
MMHLKKTSLVMVLFLGIGLVGCFEEKQEGGSAPTPSEELTELAATWSANFGESTPATSGELTDAQKLEQWKLGDWLHDIDAAERVMEAAKKGDFGQPNQDLVVKLEPARMAHKYARNSLRECFAREPGSKIDIRLFDTANTDHACLDAKGYKRSQ